MEHEVRRWYGVTCKEAAGHAVLLVPSASGQVRAFRELNNCQFERRPVRQCRMLKECDTMQVREGRRRGVLPSQLKLPQVDHSSARNALSKGLTLPFAVVS